MPKIQFVCRPLRTRTTFPVNFSKHVFFNRPIRDSQSLPQLLAVLKPLASKNKGPGSAPIKPPPAIPDHVTFYGEMCKIGNHHYLVMLPVLVPY